MVLNKHGDSENAAKQIKKTQSYLWRLENWLRTLRTIEYETILTFFKNLKLTMLTSFYETH